MLNPLTRKHLLPLLAAPALFLASCGSGSSTPSTSTNSSAQSVSSVSTVKAADTGSQTRSTEEDKILNAINEVRAVARKCGDQYFPAAPAVTWNGYLAAAARGHASDMAAKSYFSHTSQDGRTLKNRVEAAGYTGWSELGENIAAGYGVSSVMQGWLDSASHCSTLMDPALKEVGVGYVFQAGTQYGTYWVTDFGTR